MKSTIKTVKHFTLIELFIAMTVLLILAGVVGWHVKGAIDHHHFQASVDQFAVQLRELQALALSYQSDMEVEFSRDGKMITYKRNSDEPKETLTMLDRSIVSLKGVTEMLFNDKKNETLKLTVLSTGRIEPAGIIHFQQNKESLWVDFSTPLLVKLCTEKPGKKNSILPTTQE